MSYRIVLFDGLPVPEYIRRGDQQDMGTGAALTSFLSLPGGGFYDNYRDRISPQGVRPISKSGIFWGTPAQLRAQLDAWRGKIGKRGRLTVEFDDGSLRWQWARLQDVSAPRPSTAKANWLPFTLTWVTASQHWRGIVHKAGGWTWGDDTWTFGDGSAQFGGGAQTFNVVTSGTQFEALYNGNIDAANLVLRFTLTGGWRDLTVINHTTGQQIFVDRALTDNSRLVEINTGARSIYLGGSLFTLNTSTRNQNTLTVSANAHGLVTGNGVRLEGTDRYDGDYYPVTVIDANTFTVPLSPRHTGFGAVLGGTGRRMTDLYGLTHFSDIERWLVLTPGVNLLQVIWDNPPDTGILAVEYDDHYA